jgi:hypothetical protein
MDYQAVAGVASGFDTAAATLKVTGTILEAAIVALKAASFFTLGTTKMLEQYLANIKPRVDRLGATCEEMAGDLRAAIADHQQADTGGAGNF